MDLTSSTSNPLSLHPEAFSLDTTINQYIDDCDNLEDLRIRTDQQKSILQTPSVIIPKELKQHQIHCDEYQIYQTKLTEIQSLSNQLLKSEQKVNQDIQDLEKLECNFQIILPRVQASLLQNHKALNNLLSAPKPEPPPVSLSAPLNASTDTKTAAAAPTSRARSLRGTLRITIPPIPEHQPVAVRNSPYVPLKPLRKSHRLDDFSSVHLALNTDIKVKSGGSAPLFPSSSSSSDHEIIFSWTEVFK